MDTNIQFGTFTKYTNIGYRKLNWISELYLDIEILDIRTLTRRKNVGYQNFNWTYKLDFRILTGHTNIGYQNLNWTYKHWLSKI